MTAKYSQESGERFSADKDGAIHYRGNLWRKKINLARETLFCSAVSLQSRIPPRIPLSEHSQSISPASSPNTVCSRALFLRLHKNVQWKQQKNIYTFIYRLRAASVAGGEISNTLRILNKLSLSCLAFLFFFFCAVHGVAVFCGSRHRILVYCFNVDYQELTLLSTPFAIADDIRYSISAHTHNSLTRIILWSRTTFLMQFNVNAMTRMTTITPNTAMMMTMFSFWLSPSPSP